MDLSIVIVHWKAERELERLLSRLLPLGGGIRELLVVDNGSQGAAPTEGNRRGPVRWLRAEGNLGFAGGANWGIRQSRGTWILLLNPDVELDPAAVRSLYEAAQEHPDTGLACPHLLDPEGRSQWSFQVRPLPSFLSVLSDALFLDELGRWWRGPGPPPGPPAGTEKFPLLQQPAAACWLLRRRCWEQLQGFDERFYPAWFEDVDFCKRLLEAGWRILYCPRIQVTHRGGGARRRLGDAHFLRIYYGNLLRYLAKHHPWSYPWLWLPVRVGLLLRLLRSLGKGGS